MSADHSGERASTSTISENAQRVTLDALAQVGDEGWRASGVSLYIIVAPGVTLAPGTQSGDRFWAQPRKLSDRVLYQIAEPASLKDGQAVKPTFALHDLPQLFAAMFAYAYTHQPALHAGGVQYVIAQCQELHAPAQTEQSQRVTGPGQVVQPWQTEKVARVVTVYLRGILDLFDQAAVGTPRGYFDHYDHVTSRTGHIAFGRTAAVLGGLSDTQLRTFVNQLSCGQMAPEGGLTPQTFLPLLTLVGQWNGNQDVRASVDMVRENVRQVRDLRLSSDNALRGTIWISWALAVIGVVTALLGYLKHPLFVVPGLVFLGISCIMHALFATGGSQKIRRFALAAFWVGTLLGAAGVVVNLLHLTLRA